MQDYWAEVAPPLDVSVAAFMGFKPSRRTETSAGGSGQYSDLGDLLRIFPGGLIN